MKFLFYFITFFLMWVLFASCASKYSNPRTRTWCKDDSYCKDNEICYMPMLEYGAEEGYCVKIDD